ncbi:MAG: hypothetical protein JSU70_07105 [Phycisphaerales bacterium]|nr:MAG: hypothetical protein JSU70_07105 [Phycisphaerales bacterium]
MFRRLFVVVVMMASTASAGIVLRVDFSSLTQDGGPYNQEGWQAYSAGHEVPADFITADYGGITVTPAWPNTTDNRVQQSIDRGAANDATWNDDAGDIDLVTDWIGIDTRTGNGGHGNWDGTTGTPTYMTLTLGGLPAGVHAWTSFHHDTKHCHGPFAVWLSTDGGATFVPLADGLMTDGTAGGTPDSGATEGGPDAYSLPSTYRTSITANGTDDVVFRFAPYSDAAGVHRQIWGMNGFELETIVSSEATQPSPGNGAPDVPRDGTVLSWQPGETADKHDVYFGTDFDDVNDASVTSDPAGVYKGRQDQASYPLGRLKFGETYYWRIDSVELGGTTIHEGVVWSFTAEPAGYPVAAADITVTASSETTGFEAVNTVNESGLDEAGKVHSTVMEDMWLSTGADTDAVWIQYEFDKVYKLYQMLVWNHNSVLEPTIGFGIKDATVAYSTDAVEWSTFDT